MRDWRRLHHGLTRGESRHIQQVVDEPRLHQRVALDDLAAPSTCRRRRAIRRRACAPSRGSRSAASAARARRSPGTRPSSGWPPRPADVRTVRRRALAAALRARLRSVMSSSVPSISTGRPSASQTVRPRPATVRSHAIGPDDPVLHLEQTAGWPVPSRTESSRRARSSRMDHRDEALIGDLEASGLDAIDAIDLVRPADRVGVEIPFPAADVRERLGLEQPALARSQRALHALAGGDLDVQLVVRQFQLVRSAEDTRRSSCSYSR